MAEVFQTRLLVASDTTANWTKNNPVLMRGEFGAEYPSIEALGDTNQAKLKIGDGQTEWNNLPYLMLSPKEIDTLLKGLTNYNFSASTDEGTVNLHLTAKTDSTNDQKVAIKGSGDVTVSTDDDGVKIDYSHPKSGAAGTWKSVTVDEKGHVTGGTNPTTLEGYGITDAYSKDDIDSKLTEQNNKLTAVYHAKGKLENKEALDALTGMEVGDVYQIGTDEWAWNGKEWYNVGMDISTATDETAGITKVYTTTGKNTDGTMSQSAISEELDKKLDKDSTVDKATSDASGQKIDETYIKDISIVGQTVTITKGDGSTSNQSTQDTTYSAGDGIDINKDNKIINKGVRSVSKSTTNGHVNVNTNGTSKDLKVYELPTAGDQLGGVKSSTDDNKIGIEADGTMKVNSLSSDKLKAGTGVLILNCGDSTIHGVYPTA